MNKHITILRIKNSDFDYTKYGLKNNYFSLDVTTSVAYAKSVGVTQYAVLDGTTRLDNISRQPATITLQGLLGELRAGNTPEHFAYNTAEKNRLQHQMDLLEALRDQAIFLDFITDERTYRNYLITSCSFGKSNFGKIDANINAQEAITFGDDISVEQTNAITSMTDYEQELLFEKFEMREINNDNDLLQETNRIITKSIFSTPFITFLGPVSLNPDVVLPEYKIIKRQTSAALPTVIGQSVTVSDTNAIAVKTEAAEIFTGTVVGGNYLHLTLPVLEKDQNLYRQRITKNPIGTYAYVNLSTTSIHLRLNNGAETLYAIQSGEILKTPLYSDIVNGVHPLMTAGSNTDIISEAIYGLCFIRKQKNNTYSLVANLLDKESRGFLYNATYEKTTSNVSTLYPVLVYIHPSAWKIIKQELKRIWAQSTYFSTKMLVGV